MWSFIKETVVYGFANIFSRISAFMLIPIYTYYLGKIDYANLVMLMSSFTVLSFLLALNSGVFYYYYEYQNPKYRKIVFTSWFFYEMIVSSIIFILLLVFSPFLKNIFLLDGINNLEVQLSLIIIGLQMFPVSVQNTYINLYRIDRKPKKVLMVVGLEALLMFIFTLVAIIFIKKSLLSVIVAQFLAKICVSIYSSKLFENISLKYFSKKLLFKLFSFSWPFFIISSFGWGIAYADKFVGSQVLIDKTDVALLALSSQLIIPIAILSQMINQALGPYIMSIRHNLNANDQYQKVLDLSVFVGSIVSIGVIGSAPIVVSIFFDPSYKGVLNVIPFMALATVIYLMSNQFSIGFSLAKKNGYLAISIIIASLVGFFVNVYFMEEYGYIVAGISQILSYATSAIMLYILSTKKKYSSFKLNNSLFIVLLLTLFLSISILFNRNNINEIFLLILSIVAASIITFTYLKQQKIDLKLFLTKLKNRS